MIFSETLDAILPLKPLSTSSKIRVRLLSLFADNDLIIKSTGAKSSLKLYLIQSIDRKLSLDDIALAKGMEMTQLISEMETIVFSGTKLDIRYEIDSLFDEDQQTELQDYFMEAENDDIQEAFEEFDGDFEEDDLRLYRIKFISEVAN